MTGESSQFPLLVNKRQPTGPIFFARGYVLSHLCQNPLHCPANDFGTAAARPAKTSNDCHHPHHPVFLHVFQPGCYPAGAWTVVMSPRGLAINLLQFEYKWYGC